MKKGEKMVGNTAATYTVLKKCEPLIEVIWENGGGEDVSAEIAEVRDLIKSALSLPIRNCDRFDSVKDAAIEFARLVAGEIVPTSDFAFSSWLMAPTSNDIKGK